MLNFIVFFLLFISVVLIVCFDKISMGWPCVKGELVDAKVIESKNIKLYSCYVLYSYMIKDKSYHSSKIVFLGHVYRNKKKADEKIKSICESPCLSVFYFPIDPSISVLEPNSSSRFMLLLIFIISIIFFIAGFVSRENGMLPFF